MEDYLVKSVAENGQFRAYAVNATALVEEAHQIHDTWSAPQPWAEQWSGPCC